MVNQLGLQLCVLGFEGGELLLSPGQLLAEDVGFRLQSQGR